MTDVNKEQTPTWCIYARSTDNIIYYLSTLVYMDQVVGGCSTVVDILQLVSEVLMIRCQTTMHRP